MGTVYRNGTYPGDFKFSGNGTIVTGYLGCDGSIVSQTTYPSLYAAIGATFNTGGEGAGNFRLPDFRGRGPMGVGTGAYGGASTRTMGEQVGEETHLLATSEMPAHTHVERGNGNTAGGTAMTNLANGDRDSASNTDSTGGGGAHNNMQPTLACNVSIKY